MTELTEAAPPRVIVCQCTSTKRDKTAEAREMYMPSAYFRKQRAYAEATGDYWFIQSAKHGLLSPTDRIEPYDKRPRHIGDVEAWAASIAASIDEAIGTPAVVEVLGGKAYADPLTPELEALGYDVLEPLRGQLIGTRQQTLKRKTNQQMGAFTQ